MQRWIVEGIRMGSTRLNAKVDIVEADNKSEAVAQVKRAGAMAGYQLSVRPAAPDDTVADLQKQLDAATKDTSRELDRLVSETAQELNWELEGEQ